MKKLFTIDDFMVAFISALGYGFGETIAKLSGWPEILCGAASFVLGVGLEELITKIVFSKAVQKNVANRVFTYAAILLVFLLGQYASIRWMGVSLIKYLQEEFVFVVGLPILGLIVNLLIRGWRVRQIRKRYGDGSEGYVFDVTDKDLEEVNRQNGAVQGEYDADCAVRTRTGVYVGEKYKEALIFAGIPYAKPPVGELRWKAPEALPSSDEVFEARNFGASAIQVEHKGSIVRHHRQSEDCLTLNIAVGTEKAEAKKPVLVLFHHGDFTSGGAVDPLLYGNNYVSAHLNLGLLDQIAALEWIRENIGAFGGDPERVTLLGFESGATCICLLAASERAKGLFQRAFVVSGSPDAAYDTPENSRALASALLKETNASTMAELMQLDTDTLKDAAQRLWMNMCAPTCDGTLIPADVYRAYRDGAASGIEFVVGIINGEVRAFRASFGSKNYEDALNAAVDELQNGMDDSIAEEVQTYLRAQTASSSELEARSKLVGQWMALGIYRIATTLSQGGNKVHLMFWDEKALIENLGSGTADVLATLLGNGEALQMYGSVMNEDVSAMLQALLEKFVSGDALQLYRNEIKGIDSFDWKAFPQALIVADGEITCAAIEDRITEVKGLVDYTVR